jgi:hypothetical protein
MGAAGLALAAPAGVPLSTNGDAGISRRCDLQYLNLNHPGLQQVRAALAAGDLAGAQAAYLVYYRRRTSPVLFWAPLYELGNSFESRSTYFDFFSTCPAGISWRDRERLRPSINRDKGYRWESDGINPSDYTLVQLADLMLENKLYHPWWPLLPPQDQGPQWDWQHLPADGDQSWTYHLHHQEFLLALAQAYWQTGDEKYVRKLVQVWGDWIERVGRPVNLSHLVQPVLYQQLLPFALSWDGLPAQDFCRVQAWLAGPNAQALMAERRVGNQLMGTGLALVWLGIGMPECKDAPRWRAEGFARIEAFLGDDSSYPDGSAKETCFHYVVGPCRSALNAIHLAQLNHVAYPRTLTAKLARAAEFLAYTAKPDGHWVWTGDGARGSALDFVARMGEIVRRPDLRYIASLGREGARPQRASMWFPYAGYGVMRSAWTRDANYLFFDVGPLGTQHQHEGKLAVEVVSYGRSLVEDLGVHTYSTAAQEIPLMQFFRESQGHNTVVADGKTQVRIQTGPYITKEPLPNPWHSCATCDFLAGSYEEGYGRFAVAVGPGGYPSFEIEGEIDRSVAHHRSVIFVKSRQPGDPEYWIITDRLTGAGEHTYEQLFHLIPCDTVAEGKVVRTVTPNEANLAFAPVLTDGLEVDIVAGRGEPNLQGWYVASLPRPAPAPCVIYRRKGTPPVIFQVVLWPLRPGQTALPQVEPLGRPGSGAMRTILPDGRVDVYCSPAGAGQHQAGDLAFDGLAALVRLDKSGRPLAWSVVRGTKLTYRGRLLPAEPGRRKAAVGP